MDDLAAYLDALEFNRGLRVVRALKTSEAETTELVSDAQGLEYVRKTFDAKSGIGNAYRVITAAQDAGASFKHLPRVHACIPSEEGLVVVMEYVRGENLWERLDAEGCGMAAAGRYFGEVCDAVAELHESFDPPIIHRDLKPTNILVCPDGGVKLLDFGISRAVRDGAQADTKVLGTREYAPPEQFGYRQTDVRSDVYSLGMVLYHLLTGQTPNAALHDAGFADADIPQALRPVLMRATEFDPDQRFASVRELLAAFVEAMGHAGDGGITTRKRVLRKTNRAGARLQPGEVVRDIVAGVVVVLAIVAAVATWPAYDPAHDAAWNLGQQASSFIFVSPAAAIAYWLSGKRLASRIFPQIRTYTWRQHALAGLALFALTAFLVFVAVLLFGFISG